MPNFEEIWPSKKKQAEKDAKRDANFNYYLDAMKTGPELPGHLPIPSNFTTVGRPQIFVNQYDSPIDCYSEVSNKHLYRRQNYLFTPENLSPLY